MVYELRKWFDGQCLYTDDRRVKDLAIRTPDLRIVGSYFRSPTDRQPFAWDIVGDPRALVGIARRFDARRRQEAIV
jgi:hypothetical protein